MKRRSFTLTELLVVIVVIGVLATLGVPMYQGVIENSKATVCEENLKALKTALDIYAMEHDTMPAAISLLPYEYIKKAYAQHMQTEGAWRVKLAYFIVEWQERGLAYAGNFVRDLAKGDIKIITCPNDPTSPAEGGISYGVNSTLVGITSQSYRSLLANTVLIGDCENAMFNSSADLSERHKHPKFLNTETYAQVVTKNGEVLEGSETSFKVKKGKGKGLSKAPAFHSDDDDD